MDFTHVFIITVTVVVLVVLSVCFTIMFKMMRNVAGMQRAIFLFMRQKFGDIEELVGR